MVKDINGRVEIPKCQKNVKIHDPELINNLLDMIPNSEVTKEKYKLDFIQLKTFCVAKETSGKVKRQLT